MQYTQIMIEEMKSYLETKGFKELEDQGGSTKEYVFEKILNPGYLPKIVIKVFTSISKTNDSGRRKGEDAIRVCAINLTQKQGWIKTVKVLRVNGWHNNLQKAIDTVIRQSTWRLRNQKPDPQTFKPPVRSLMMNDLVNDIWGKPHNDGGYSAEASTLNANKNRRPRNLCPKCDGVYGRKDLKKTIPMGDPIDHEIGGWEFVCPHCGVLLTIWND